MKKIIIILFFIIPFVFSCNQNNSAQEKTEQKKTEINKNNVIFIDVKVKGMTCEGCENAINKKVSDLPGIASVKSSHKMESTKVEYDTTLVSVDEISEAISGAGYEIISWKKKEIIYKPNY